jgi:putative membrane-bound dehydrogenase-like protein
MRVSLLLASAAAAIAAEPVVTPDQLPRIPAVPPEKAAATCEVRPGFHLELMVSEPLINDPVAMAFDEDSRLYVAEMRDYSERRDEKLGRIKVLTDRNGDGRYDHASVFAESLAWPTAVTCWDGGVFIIASPDLIYLKDTDGDGVADMRRTIVAGFAKLAPKLNVQALPNSLQWGPDQRIHGALGGNASRLEREGAEPLELRGHDFSFDPRLLDFRAETGGGQWGMTFDEQGRKFTCNNGRHIMHVRYDARFAAKADVPLPAAAVDIAVDGPQAEVFRRSPDEPWRVIRTKWRATGVVKGIVEGGGRPSGYFTSACGITIYRGDAWPAEYRGNAFIADCGSNLIHRKVLHQEGAAVVAKRAPGEEKREFIASSDNWFRPVAFANAPDGNLWFCDMYREIVEHPWSLPESLKKNLDLNSGNDRGRIYRIVPDGHSTRPAVKLGELDNARLAALLEHPNGWHRDTAARLLHTRQDTASLPAIAKLVAARTPKAPELSDLIRPVSKTTAAATTIPLPPASGRKEAWELYRPALTRKGNADKGRATFEARCALCHRFGGKGQNVGPDLDASRQAGREKLLGNILEPSREITAGYGLGIVELKNGSTVAGILANESPAGVLLRIAGGGDQPVKQSDIAKIQRPAQSLMPEGIEAGLTVDDMADLLEYLSPQ